MKKFVIMFFTVLLPLFCFTGCPVDGCWTEEETLYDIKGIETSLDTTKLESEGLITVSLKGVPVIDCKEKKNFDLCYVRILVVNEGDEDVKIKELVSFSNPAYKEWKYYDNDIQKLEVTEVKAKYLLNPKMPIDDEVVLKVEGNDKFYVYIDLMLNEGEYGYIAEEFYHLNIK